MNGQWLANTPIVVDYWVIKDVHPRSLFFLTHMHADHTAGLSEHWSQPIHCTPVTAKLLQRKFNVQSNLIVELEYGEPRILTVNVSKRVTITVTALDAKHCPGSAMFLFEGYFGTILYTGDFRYCPSMLQNPALNGSCTIDVLYLDNTYCDSECTFPTREEATELIINLINDHPTSAVLFGLHTLGKELLLIELASRLQEWIGVSEDRYETFELLEMPNVFTTEREKCRLRTYENYFITKNLAPEMVGNQDYIAILPTCLYTGKAAPPLPEANPRLKIVEYSDHSSFPELCQFVEAVKPRRIVPIVHNFADKSAVVFRCNMSIFDELLDKSESPVRAIPDAIKNMFEPQYAHSKSTPVHFKTKQPIAALRANKCTPKGIQYLSPQKIAPSQEENTDSSQAAVAEGGPTKRMHSWDDIDSCARLIPLHVLSLKRVSHTPKQLGSPPPKDASTHKEASSLNSPAPRDAPSSEQPVSLPQKDTLSVEQVSLELADSLAHKDAPRFKQVPSNSPIKEEARNGVVQERSNSPSGLMDTSVPLSAHSDTVQRQKVLSQDSTSHKEPDFLKTFPYEGLKRLAMQDGYLSPLQGVPYPESVHSWDSSHHIDKGTNICTCPKGRSCLLSFCVLNELS